MNKEPVITAASIAGLLSAGISLCRIMGWIALTDDQYNALMLFLGIALPIGLGVWARNESTPLSDPKDTDGVALTRPGDVLVNKKMAPIQAEAIQINRMGGEL